MGLAGLDASTTVTVIIIAVNMTLIIVIIIIIIIIIKGLKTFYQVYTEEPADGEDS